MAQHAVRERNPVLFNVHIQKSQNATAHYCYTQSHNSYTAASTTVYGIARVKWYLQFFSFRRAHTHCYTLLHAPTIQTACLVYELICCCCLLRADALHDKRMCCSHVVQVVNPNRH